MNSYERAAYEIQKLFSKANSGNLCIIPGWKAMGEVIENHFPEASQIPKLREELHELERILVQGERDLNFLIEKAGYIRQIVSCSLSRLYTHKGTQEVIV